MKPAPLDLPIIWRGCTYPAIRIVWNDGDGQPLDLTGWTPRAYSRFFQFNTRVLNPPTSGVTVMSLPISVTSGLKLGVTNWDFIWTQNDAPNTVSGPFLKGSVEVKEPITDPATPVMGRIGGGSDLVKLFPETQQGYRFISLVGRYHLNWPHPPPPAYLPPPPPPPVAIAPVARSVMEQMVANGQTKIMIMLWFEHAYLDVPDIASRVAMQYVDNVNLIPFNPSGIEGDVHVRLTPQQEQNLITIINDVKAAGFIQLDVRFADVEFASDFNWPEKTTEHNPNPPHTWLPERFQHNVNYIFSIVDIVEANRGDLTVVYDLGSEHGNSRLWPVAPPEGNQDATNVHRQYCTLLWSQFVNRFGQYDSMAFSCHGGADGRIPGLTNVPVGYAALLDLLHLRGLPRPGYYGVDLYGDGSHTEVTQKLVAMYDWTKAHHPVQADKPIIIQETIYNDGIVASQLEQALFERPINLHSIFQWPQHRGGALLQGPPVLFDAYRTI